MRSSCIANAWLSSMSIIATLQLIQQGTDQMTENYQEIIEAEQLRIEQLETELTQHRALLQALMIVEGHTAPATAPTSTETALAETSLKNNKTCRLPAYIHKESLPLLRSIKDQALSADAIALFCRQVGVNIDREAVLFRLGLYRRNYAMVETVSHGFYRLTEKGRRYINKRYPEISQIARNQTDHISHTSDSFKLPDISIFKKINLNFLFLTFIFQ